MVWVMRVGGVNIVDVAGPVWLAYRGTGASSVESCTPTGKQAQQLPQHLPPAASTWECVCVCVYVCVCVCTCVYVCVEVQDLGGEGG